MSPAVGWNQDCAAQRLRYLMGLPHAVAESKETALPMDLSGSAAPGTFWMHKKGHQEGAVGEAEARSHPSVFQLLSSSIFTGKWHSAPCSWGHVLTHAPHVFGYPSRCTVCPAHSQAHLPVPHQFPHGHPSTGT